MRGANGQGRRGAAALDYVLILCIVMPMMAFVFWIGPQILQRVYEMACVLISWPFL